MNGVKEKTRNLTEMDVVNQKFILAGVLMLSLLTAGCGSSKQGKVCARGNCFDVELAQNPEERARGLMFREQLDSDKGMLFIYENECKDYFWMKDTLIPLDIIWINGNKEVVFISKNMQPCSSESCDLLSPEVKAKYVLELNGGTSDKIGLSEGDKVIIELL